MNGFSKFLTRHLVYRFAPALTLFALLSGHALAGPNDNRAVPVTSEFFVSVGARGSGGLSPKIANVGNGRFLVLYTRLPSPAENDPTQSQQIGTWGQVWDEQGHAAGPLVKVLDSPTGGSLVADEVGHFSLGAGDSVKIFNNLLELTLVQDDPTPPAYPQSMRVARAADGRSVVLRWVPGFDAELLRFDSNLVQIGNPIHFPSVIEQSDFESQDIQIAISDQGVIAALLDYSQGYVGRPTGPERSLFLRTWNWEGDILLQPTPVYSRSDTVVRYKRSLSFTTAGDIRVMGSTDTNEYIIDFTEQIFGVLINHAGQVIHSAQRDLAGPTGGFRPPIQYAGGSGQIGLIVRSELLATGPECIAWAFGMEGFSDPLLLDISSSPDRACSVAVNDEGIAFVSWGTELDGTQQVRGQIFDIANSIASEPLPDNSITIGPPQVCIDDVNSIVDVTWPEELELRVRSPNGPLFRRAHVGAATTGLWARQGLVFFAVDPSSGDLSDWQKVRLDVVSDECPDPDIILEPATLCGSPTAVEVLWSYPDLMQSRVQIRLNSPSGRIFKGADRVGSAMTGPWVRHKMRFFAMAGNQVLGAVTARERCTNDAGT